jgi:CRP/FNR family transcriptional regulator, anaerobic regulatory protein
VSSKLRANIEKRISITDLEWYSFLAIHKTQHLRKRELWLKSGDVCNSNAYVVKGCLRTYYKDLKGHDHILQFSIEDWWVADLMSFITGNPSNLSIEALEETELLVAEKDELNAFYEHSHKFEKFRRIMAQAAFVSSQQRIISGMSKNAEERYLDFLQKFPNLDQRIAQHHIASYLGITPEALSRTKKAILDKSKDLID